MTCDGCAGALEVIDSREVENVVRRRRRCLVCSSRTTTYEISAEAYLVLNSLSKSATALATARTHLQTIETALEDIAGPRPRLAAIGATDPEPRYGTRAHKSAAR